MRRLWGTTALAAIMGMAGAAQAQDAQQVAESETVTVTATRTEAETFEVPATVTVITEEAIDENLVADIKDLVRFEPGVSVRTNPARYSAANGTGRDGNSSFNIRGLEGNRVLMAIDGFATWLARLPVTKPYVWTAACLVVHLAQIVQATATPKARVVSWLSR